MAKRTLERPPLIYAHAYIIFSGLTSPHVGSSDTLQALHRALAKIGFADRIDSSVKQLEFVVNTKDEDGYFAVKNDAQELQRVIFRGFAESKAVEISQNRIVFRQTRYESSTETFEIFEKVLLACQHALPDLQHALVKQAGLRYVDGIFPSVEHEARHYLNSGLAPFNPSFSRGTTGTSQSVVKTDVDQVMLVTVEELSCAETNAPRRWLPVDLLEPDEKAAMRLFPNVSSYDPGKNYFLFSIDHKKDFHERPLWSVSDILEATRNLHSLSSAMFWGSLTAVAEREWGKK